MKSSPKSICFLKSNSSRNQKRPKQSRFKKPKQTQKKKNQSWSLRTRNHMIKKRKEMLKAMNMEEKKREREKEHLLARRDNNRSTFQSKPLSYGKANTLSWSGHNYHFPFKSLSTDNLTSHPSFSDLSLLFANYKTRQASKTKLVFKGNIATTVINETD